MDNNKKKAVNNPMETGARGRTLRVPEIVVSSTPPPARPCRKLSVHVKTKRPKFKLVTEYDSTGGATGSLGVQNDNGIVQLKVKKGHDGEDLVVLAVALLLRPL